jgi:hypothetical protein
MGAGKEPAAPPFSFVELPDQDQEMVGGGVKMGCQTGDLVAETFGLFRTGLGGPGLGCAAVGSPGVGSRGVRSPSGGGAAGFFPVHFFRVRSRNLVDSRGHLGISFKHVRKSNRLGISFKRVRKCNHRGIPPRLIMLVSFNI